jgi:hypothetical protein
MSSNFYDFKLIFSLPWFIEWFQYWQNSVYGCNLCLIANNYQQNSIFFREVFPGIYNFVSWLCTCVNQFVYDWKL